MPVESDVTEVTAPVDFQIVEDRLHFTLTSGSRKRTYAISFHKARGAIQAGIVLLDQHDLEQAGKVKPLARRGASPRHA